MDKKFLILIVDDNAACRELLVWTLERHGFQTISAKCGREAVKMAAQWQPGLILMDLNMPVMNGYQATRTIHAHRHGRKIPVIAVSADCGAYGFERWAFKSGFTTFLAKPWEEKALL